MKRALVLVLLLLLAASIAQAGIVISEPKNRSLIYPDVTLLKGQGRDLKYVRVNNQAIKFNDDGSFTCGLILRRGKNLVQVIAGDIHGQIYTKELRLVGLKTFPDIEMLYDGKKHWARSQIIHLATLKFVEGYPDDNFYPGNPVTRGELATWLARIKKLPLPTLTDDVFFDVPKEHWRAPFIKAVVDAGIMAPYDNLMFGLDDPISRRRAAETVIAAEGVDVVEKIKSIFIDVPKSEQGAMPIFVAKEKGLVKGVSATIPVYEPERALTRAEACILISRFKRAVKATRYLFNFQSGFDRKALCGVNIAPEIVSFAILPDNLKVGANGTVHLEAKLASRVGFSSLANVKVDLTEIGGLPDVELYDDGLRGDQSADDQIYSLNLALQPKESGTKTFTVTAVDRLGWEGKARAQLTIND